jgi:hypothetical protein
VFLITVGISIAIAKKEAVDMNIDSVIDLTGPTIAMVAGAILGVIFGGITSASYQAVSPAIVILGALCSCTLFVWWLDKGLTESFESLAGGIFGGAISGIIAGYLGTYLMR